jgi:MFS family permease
VTGGRAADRASLRHRSSLVFVLSVVWGNRQLRRVELAFATFSAGEWAWWIAMLVYAYAQGVTESGILATVLLIPAAAFPPAMTAVGERYAPGS